MNKNKTTVQNKKIAVLPGDGIGPEIVREAVKVLNAVEKVFGHKFDVETYPVGGCAYDLCGESLPKETLSACKSADAVLLGAVGGPKWDGLSGEKRPESALLGLRSELGLFANLRPAKIWPSLLDSSPLKKEIISDGIDILVVRELTGGIYFGAHSRSPDKKIARDEMAYSEFEVERIAKVAFECAKSRNKKVTSVDKANVLESSRLWREVVERVSKDYPEVELNHMYVDNAAMQLVRNPGLFDVLLTENMFGDILSDEASQITGSIGMLPSASLRHDGFGMYEPIHGSAPDIAGKNIANPLATILSVAMMLRSTFLLNDEANAIEEAVSNVLLAGLRTADLTSPDAAPIGTSQMGDAVAKAILNMVK